MSLVDTAAPAAPARQGVRHQLRELVSGSATPERLRRVGAVLVVAFLLSGAVSLASAVSKADAVRDGSTRAAALAADASELYRSLADADVMATSGFASGGFERPGLRTRYDADVARAAGLLVRATARLSENDPAAAASVATISTQLPVYHGWVEAARAYNRQGLPLGQSYLGNASRLMRDTILPAAVELRRTQTAALTTAFDRGAAIPFVVLLLWAGALAALVDVSVRERRRTQRVLSVGLVAAGTATVVALLWWVVAMSVAGASLADAERHSTRATALDDARTAVLQARSNESLVLVARSGGSASDEGFTAQLGRVLGTDTEPGLLVAAADDADPASVSRVAAVRAAAEEWINAHRLVRELDDGGRYREAVAAATGIEPSNSGAAFERLETELSNAITAERAEFRADAATADNAVAGLAGGSAVLALLAAAAAAVAIDRRVGEYR